MAKVKLEMEQTELLGLFAWSSKLDSPEGKLLFKLLSDKVDRMIAHDLYTTSKTALTEEEREAARQRYLDKKGIPQSFRR